MNGGVCRDGRGYRCVDCVAVHIVFGVWAETMKRATQVWYCPTANCGYRSKPQSRAVNSMSHRCPIDGVDRELKPV